MSKSTCLNKNILDAQNLATQFNKINTEQYGPEYTRYLLDGSGNIDEMKTYNDKMIGMSNNLNSAIINTNQDIITTQDSIQKQDKLINQNLQDLNTISDNTVTMEQKNITLDKIIANTEQKNIFAKHIYSVLIILNIILFIIVIGLLRKN